MGKVTDDDVERVRAFVAAIPRGSVTTYGDLATAAGLSSPRIVGWIMRTDSADLPWHRVIGAGGRPAAHKAQLQLDLLADDGVPIVDGRVLQRAHHFIGTIAIEGRDADRLRQIPQVHLGLLEQQVDQRGFGFHGDHS